MLKRFWPRFKFFISHPRNSLNYMFSNRNDYSRISIEEIKAFIVNPELIVEAGCADGVDTQSFAMNFPNARIIGLEPVQEQYLFLKDKFKSLSNICILNFALSDQNGISIMHLGSSSGHLGGLGSSSLLEPEKHEKFFPEIEFRNKESVITKTLESLLLNYELVDLLWLDIQGKELDVLRKSYSAFTEKVKLIHLEISRVELYKGMPSKKEIGKFLKYAGFVCVIDRVGAVSGNALYMNRRFQNPQI